MKKIWKIAKAILKTVASFFGTKYVAIEEGAEEIIDIINEKPEK